MLLEFESVSAHNFVKLSSMEVYNTVHNYDIICLPETYLDSSFSSNDPDLFLDGYKLIRADNPNNVRRGGVCVSYRESLPLRVTNFHHLPECLVVEMKHNNQSCYIVSLYRSPSQNNDEFDEFLKNFEFLLDNVFDNQPQFVIILGDFNAKLSNWRAEDISSYEGIKLESVTSLFGLKQLISEPTHLLPNSTSCIDLIFTNHPNLVVDCGVHPSLHTNCHHQIVFAEINLKVFFPPPYERQIWHYKRADIFSIHAAINNFDWEMAFSNLDVENQVELFNTIILNIMSNFIPNESITINDKDPPWMCTSIKNLISLKNSLFRDYLRNGKSDTDLNRVEAVRKDLIDAINLNKKEHYDRLNSKLRNPKTSSKAYWSILRPL